MKMVCYAFKNERGELEVPFFNYLEKYAIKKQDSEHTKEQRAKWVMNVKAHLEYLLNHQGRYTLPPLAEQYKHHKIGILKIKESTSLVRIAFFTKTGDMIVLLDAIDKPKLYEKAKKQKVDNMIEKFLDRAESYRLDFLSNHLFSSLPLTLLP